MTVRIDPTKINAYRKFLGLTLKDIEVESCGSITEDQLKYALNRSLTLRKSLLSILASILRCSLDDLVDDEYQRKMEIPVSVQLFTSRMYTETKTDFCPSYSEYVRDKQKSPGFQALMVQASQLFLILTKKVETSEGLPNLIAARDFIVSQFEDVSQSVIFEGIDSSTMSWFLKNLRHIPESETFALCLYVFTYTLLVFESLMHHELVSSAIYLSAQRTRDTVNQYAALASPLEISSQMLLDIVLNRGGVSSFDKLKEYSFEDVLYEKVLLLVAASKEIVNHVKSPRMASEYLNRKEVNAIVQELLNVLGEMHISVDTSVGMDIARTRFGIRYLSYRENKRFLEKLIPGVLDNELSRIREDVVTRVSDSVAQQQRQMMNAQFATFWMFGNK